MHRISGPNVDTSTGVSLFRTSVPYTTITPEWCNAIQEELMNIVAQGGLPVLNSSNDTRDQLWNALTRNVSKYDLIITSQTQFDDAIERNGANDYQFKDEYTSVYVKPLTGGYSVPLILDGGDAWGDIKTNNVTFLEFQPGAYFNMGDARGNITVNTDDCYLNNVDIRGLGLVADGVTESFYLQADRVVFNNCKTSLRLSNVEFRAFEGSATASHQLTSKYNNCSAYQIDTTGAVALYGFYECDNLSGCIATDLDSGGISCGFRNCDDLIGCHSEDIDSSSAQAYGYYGCNRLATCYVYDIQSGNNQSVYGFRDCNKVSNCEAKQIDGIGSGTAYGFHSCRNLAGCQAEDIDAAGASASAIGYQSCYNLSACEAHDIDSALYNAFGFHTCETLSGCRCGDVTSNRNAVAMVAYGFHNCSHLAGCDAGLVAAAGANGNSACYNSCTCVSACESSSVSSVGGTNYGIISSVNISSFKMTSGSASGNSDQDDAGNLYSCNNI